MDAIGEITIGAVVEGVVGVVEAAAEVGAVEFTLIGAGSGMGDTAPLT